MRITVYVGGGDSARHLNPVVLKDRVGPDEEDHFKVADAVAYFVYHSHTVNIHQMIIVRVEIGGVAVRFRYRLKPCREHFEAEVSRDVGGSMGAGGQLLPDTDTVDMFAKAEGKTTQAVPN